jgi:hypothetical protein
LGRRLFQGFQQGVCGRLAQGFGAVEYHNDSGPLEGFQVDLMQNISDVVYVYDGALSWSRIFIGIGAGIGAP